MRIELGPSRFRRNDLYHYATSATQLTFSGIKMTTDFQVYSGALQGLQYALTPRVRLEKQNQVAHIHKSRPKPLNTEIVSATLTLRTRLAEMLQ